MLTAHGEQQRFRRTGETDIEVAGSTVLLSLGALAKPVLDGENNAGPSHKLVPRKHSGHGHRRRQRRAELGAVAFGIGLLVRND